MFHQGTTHTNFLYCLERVGPCVEVLRNHRTLKLGKPIKSVCSHRSKKDREVTTKAEFLLPRAGDNFHIFPLFQKASPKVFVFLKIEIAKNSTTSEFPRLFITCERIHLQNLLHYLWGTNISDWKDLLNIVVSITSGTPELLFSHDQFFIAELLDFFHHF